MALPNLIIAGVNKAATTSLYTYLSQHPEVCASSVKETNYFMPVVSGDPLPPLEVYAAYFRDCTQRRYRMEASPRYIFGGAALAEAIRNCLGPTRIILVFRQPVERLVSYFKHMKRTQELPVEVSCDTYAARALGELPAGLAKANGRPLNVYKETIFVRGLAQGFYADYLEEWYSVFPDSIRIYFFEHLTKDPRAVMCDLCQWLGLDSSVYQEAEFTWENRSIKHRNQALFSIAETINERFEPFWRRHRKLKAWARDFYCRLNEARSEDRDLPPERRAELESVYHPYNQRLAKLLSQKGYRNLPAWLPDMSGADVSRRPQLIG